VRDLVVGKLKLILICALFLLLVSTGWQIAASELAYYELQDELKDIASLNSSRIGLTTPKSDDDLRDAVIDKARSHDIALRPNQITVRRSGSDDAPFVYLAVDYKTRIALPGYSFTLRFHPTSGKKR